MPSFNARRKFLLGSTALISGGLAYRYQDKIRNLISTQIAADPKLNNTLSAIADTIIPNDGIGLGLHDKLESKMKIEPKTQALTDRLFAAIEQYSLTKYHEVFYQLGVDDREELLNAVLKGKASRQSRVDLKRVRSYLLTWYFTSDAGQASLDYALPSRYPAYQTQALV